MLQVSISKIPTEGLEVDEVVNRDVLALAAEELSIADNGSFRAHVERADAGSVHVRGHLHLNTSGPCARCLAETPLLVDQELDLFFLPESEALSEYDDEEGAELQDRDLVVTFYKGDVIDLGAVVREHVLLAQPMKRLCREDCKGVCPTCGADRNLPACACPAPAKSESPFSSIALLGTVERASGKNAR
ncbi:MAG: DUF177 domain-containing protein [Vicinamibacteria bacterium]|nr:DUF177 domain-containing protein [Vicinamibacteria bacterium]